MKITTRAVYDMTDPRFWGEDFEQAKIIEESYECDGPVSLCMPSDGGSHGGNDPTGSQSGMSGDSSSSSGGGSDDGPDSADIGAALGNNLASRTGINKDGTGPRGAFDSQGNPTMNRSSRGGYYTNAYGVAQYAQDHNMGLARAIQQVAARDAANRYANRRNTELGVVAALNPTLHENIERAGFSPTAALGLHESVINGEIGNLQAAGVMSDDQAQAMADAYGGAGYQALQGVERGLGVDLGLTTPTGVVTPSETYADAVSKGLVGADGSLTAKGYLSMAAAPLSIAANVVAPAVASSLGTTAGIGTALGMAGLANYANSLGPGSGVSTAVGKGAEALGVSLPGVATSTVGTMANMANLASAVHAANPNATVDASVDGSVSGGGDMSAADYLSGTTVASRSTTPAVNNYATYMSRYNTPNAATSTLNRQSYTGLNMFA